MNNTEILTEGNPSFKPFNASLKESGQFPLSAAGIKTFQVNIGRLCNQACRHCHADAGPARKELMAEETMELCLDVLKKERYPVVDITGGAPEMHPGFKRFVRRCRELGCHVKTRTNLTILFEKGYDDLPGFFAENGLEVIASLPYYSVEMTDRQRGKGIFDKSIKALGMLNKAGYGKEGGELALNLVYNPCGAFLPPSQKSIEADFRRELKKKHNITFSNLFTITNMPVGRFLDFLKDSGNLRKYFDKLQASYNGGAAANVMCKTTISVGWDGTLYDCDFNQMLGLKCGSGSPDHLKNFNGKKLGEREIMTGPHCYGCTAGAGSSCTGAVV